MASLKQVTARNRAFLVVQTSDHITGLAAATPVVNISKNGSTPLHTAGATVTELGKGWYNAALTTSDTNTLGDLVFHVDTASGDPTDWLDEVTGNILGDTIPASVAGTVTTGTNLDKAGYALTQAFPSNFSSLAVTGGGAVTVGTNSDKTGYSLSQAFPSNFSSLGINAAGALSQSVTSGTVLDKTGYSLAGTVTTGTNLDKTGYGLTAATIASFFTTQMIEAYAALHVAPTLAQALFELRAHHSEKSISNTSVTLNMIDGATFAEGFNLNNTSPTSITRAS